MTPVPVPMTIPGWGYACGLCGERAKGMTREAEREIERHMQHCPERAGERKE
jgi:hypothetical protein